MCFRVHIKEHGYVSVEKCAPGAKGDNVVHLRRLHNTHPSNKQFKQMIAFLSGTLTMSGLILTIHFL